MEAQLKTFRDEDISTEHDFGAWQTKRGSICIAQSV